MPGFFRNIKRSVIDGVMIEELDVRDPSLKEEILRRYGKGPIKLWGVKEALSSRWASIEAGDYVLFCHAGKLIYAFLFPYGSNSQPQYSPLYLE